MRITNAIILVVCLLLPNSLFADRTKQMSTPRKEACLAQVMLKPPREPHERPDMQKRPTIEEMQNAKFGFMAEKADLSEQERQVTKPIFLQYERSFWELHKKHRESRKKEDFENLTEEDFRNANQRSLELEIAKTQLLKEYQERLKKVLSPKKLFLYNGAENEYKRKLLDRPENR